MQKFVEEILHDFSDDERILMWDIYNEPGQFGIGESNYLARTCMEVGIRG